MLSAAISWPHPSTQLTEGKKQSYIRLKSFFIAHLDKVWAHFQRPHILEELNILNFPYIAFILVFLIHHKKIIMEWVYALAFLVKIER